MMLKHYLDDLTKDDQAYAEGYADGFLAGRQFERDQPNRWDKLTQLLCWIMWRKPK